MSDRLSCFTFVEQFIRVEDPVTGLVGPMVLYEKQQNFVEAVLEARDGAGLRPYRRGVFSVPKKLGKTALAAAIGLFLLLFDEFEKSREVYSIAHDLDQAGLIFWAAKKMIRRSSRLLQLEEQGRLKVSKDVIGYEWGDESGIFRCLANDTHGLHGISPSCLLVDETWNMKDYDLLEACALPPTRRCPVELHFSYAGLKGQQNDGVPLWDLFQAGTSGSDPTLFFLYESGRDASFLAPWMTAAYLEERQRALPSNRFKRLHYNEWALRIAASSPTPRSAGRCGRRFTAAESTAGPGRVSAAMTIK